MPTHAQSSRVAGTCGAASASAGTRPMLKAIAFQSARSSATQNVLAMVAAKMVTALLALRRRLSCHNNQKINQRVNRGAQSRVVVRTHGVARTSVEISRGATPNVQANAARRVFVYRDLFLCRRLQSRCRPSVHRWIQEVKSQLRHRGALGAFLCEQTRPFARNSNAPCRQTTLAWSAHMLE